MARRPIEGYHCCPVTARPRVAPKPTEENAGARPVLGGLKRASINWVSIEGRIMEVRVAVGDAGSAGVADSGHAPTQVEIDGRAYVLGAPSIVGETA